MRDVRVISPLHQMVTWEGVTHKELEEKAGRGRRILPRDVECPHCKAKVDYGCVSENYKGRRATKTHAKRWLAVGMKSPTEDERHRDYMDGRERDLRLSQQSSGCR